MTDEQRRDIDNGIWLCKECARKIDIDEAKYSVSALQQWKKGHEKWVSDGKPEVAGRNIIVKNGGIGGFICNEGPGIGLDIQHTGKGPAEQITVEGAGIGEIIINSGTGSGKRVVSFGGTSASESHVIVNRPVKMAAGMVSKLVLTNCQKCGRTVQLSKVIQAFAGDSEPLISVNCPHCGGSNTI
jgi:DNA-directed RNA polymerase subunit M/transcription elongation factor TFIIS